MGYDFSIGIMRNGNPQTDLENFSLEELTIEMQLDEDKFNQHMAEFPGICKNSCSWRWNVPEGGTLDISISNFMIYIDTHADSILST